MSHCINTHLRTFPRRGKIFTFHITELMFGNFPTLFLIREEQNDPFHNTELPTRRLVRRKKNIKTARATVGKLASIKDKQLSTKCIKIQKQFQNKFDKLFNFFRNRHTSYRYFSKFRSQII